MYVTSILIMFLTDHISNYICNLRMDINAFAPDASGGQEGLGSTSLQVYMGLDPSGLIAHIR